eukprot:3031955-Pleurochrysis_carterae.AAC.3
MYVLTLSIQNGAGLQIDLSRRERATLKSQHAGMLENESQQHLAHCDSAKGVNEIRKDLLTCIASREDLMFFSP